MRRTRACILIAAMGAACAPLGTRAEPLPSLDELLGLVEPGETLDEDLLDADQADLERELSAEAAREQLEQAVELMGDATDRLASATGDTGLPTQRLQEDILRRLDMVIDAAEQQQSSSSSGSSSSSSSSESPTARQSQAAGQPSSGTNEAEGMPSDSTDAELDPDFLAEQADWGALPERTRDALLEGLSDSFSSLYRRLTERYYRRLAQPAEGDE